MKESFIPTEGLWKFVKVNGEYRFTECSLNGKYHSDLVMEDEQAESAGTIDIREDFFQLAANGGYSITLKIGCSQEDLKYLAVLLDKPYSSKWI